MNANEFKDIFYNAEGYYSPTEGVAIMRITKEQELKEEEKKVSELIKNIKSIAKLAGYKISGRIVLVNETTKKVWK